MSSVNLNEEHDLASLDDFSTVKRKFESNSTINANESTSKEKENIIEKEVLLARERERQLRREREARIKEMAELDKLESNALADNYANNVNKVTSEILETKENLVKASLERDNREVIKEGSTLNKAELFTHQSNTSTNNGVYASNIVAVSYEEVIANPEHQQEGLIFEEIKAHKAREEELKRAYSDRGIQLNDNHNVNFDDPVVLAQEINSQPVHEHHFDEQRENKGTNKNLTSNGKASSQNTVTTDVSEKANKNALANWQMIDSQSYRYVPHAETPIEREIRLNQERENELRHKYGSLQRRESEEKTVKNTNGTTTSIRRQRQDKTDVNVKEKRLTFEKEGSSNTDEKRSSNALAIANKWDNRRSSEIIIEQEMREMRAREEELRLLRLNSNKTE